MTYTVWIHGQQIGETKFEMNATRRRKAGTFHPTEFGLHVLPSITAMMPALFDFNDMCKRRGLDPDDPAMDRDRAMSAFTDTDEGQRIIAAAEQIEQVEVRDPAGHMLSWESLLISDLEWLIEKAESGTEPGDAKPRAEPTRDPVRFMISLTLRQHAHEGRKKNAEMQ